MNRLIITTSLAAGALCGAGLAQAATFCASNTTQLQQALTTASDNGDHDTIRIATGSYPAPTGGFRYDASAPGGDDKNIAISGGWTEFFGNPCGQILAQNPLLTTLDGGGTRHVLTIKVRPNSAVAVRLLMFFDGKTASEGSGLFIDAPDSTASRMDIEHNVFFNNAAEVGAGLYSFNQSFGDARLYVANNLFVGNRALAEAGAAELGLDDGHVYITNNTVVLNTLGAENRLGDFTVVGGIVVGGSGEFLIANNNLWGNQGSDLHSFAESVRLLRNNIGVRTGDTPEVESGNISVEPVYEGGLFNFTPVYYSPLVNAGAIPPTFCVPPFCWSLGATDAAGNPRLVGPRADIGAYESQEAELIFVNGFDPDAP